MKSFTSILGWLLLIALVAVPSFLFYNWLTQSKKAASEELASAPAVNVFPPAAAQPEGSSQPAVSPAAGQPQAQPAARQMLPAPQPVQEQPQAQAPAAAQAPAEQPPSASASAPETPAENQEGEQAPAGEQPAVEVSTVPKPISYYEPKSERDPTFSPADYRRIKEERLAREEAARMQALSERRTKAREPGPETRISLQGIVGNAAIINGDMYYVNQTVRGVKIVKIGADYVIGDYKGKKFRKVLK
ncbi:MAG TPA: hypothetical protein DEQ38_07930 [Elusimicrobia bacterium]|nr:MAG: hypothetical protein A2089_06205 [Elusimicrobia bacterium GWD2_63_28]HCC48024.1 hypothetical protein [Elusimicrobiota bacterium]